MTLPPKYLLPAALVACIILIFCFDSFVKGGSVFAPPPASDSSIADVTRYWQERIEKNGGKEAYQAFLSWNTDTTGEKRHLYAHVFGELLFAESGVNGISFCDASFGFGCYHGFFGRAVSSGGQESIGTLDAACVTAFGFLGTGCQHGIGHGILEYVGPQRLLDALALCGKTTEVSPYLGCASGVFMEYNTPLIEGEGTKRPETRTLDTLHPYEPCTSVPEQYVPSCYIELGSWVTTISASPEEPRSFCTDLSGEERVYCIFSVGQYMAFRAHLSEAGSVASCGDFSGDDLISCRAGVRWALWSSPESREASATACAFSDESAAARCNTLGDLTAGIDPHYNEAAIP